MKNDSLTTAQVRAYWRAFAAAAREQGIPTAERDDYRHGLMREACAKMSLRDMNRTDDYDRVMARLWRDAGDFEQASRYLGGDATRLAAMVADCCEQLLSIKSRDRAIDRETYIAAILRQAGCHVSKAGQTYRLDVSDDMLKSLFSMIDTARRRELSRHGSGGAYRYGRRYSWLGDRLIYIDETPPPSAFEVHHA